MKTFSVLASLGGMLCMPVPHAHAQTEETVTVAMHYTEEEAAPLRACFDRYEAANPGTTIDYQQISYGEYLQTILTARIGGTAPDIYNVYSIWGAQMVDDGLLAPAPDEVAAYVAEAYLPETVAAATIDGTLWGIPTEVSVYMLVSNMALLEKAGFTEPPKTWDELVDMAGKITTRNDQGRIETAGFAFAKSSTGAGFVHPFYTLMFSEGASVYGDGFATANLDGPETAAAADRLASMVRAGVTELSVDAYDFPAGGIAMAIMANWYKSTIAEGLGDDFGAVRVTPIPMGEDWRTMQYAFYMGVDSQSDVQDRAWDIVRWVNSPESSATPGGPSCVGAMMDGLGALTANRADRTALGEMDAFTQAYWDALRDGQAIGQPNVLQASEIERLIAGALERIIAGGAETGATLADLDAQVERILAEFY